MSIPPFPAEQLLQVQLPQWESELLQLKCLVVAIAIPCLIGLPWLLSQRVTKADEKGRQRRYKIPWYAGFLGLFIFLASTVMLVAYLSPYNRYYTRSVFQTPIMTEEECQRVIDMAFAAAERNVIRLSNRDEWSETEEQVMEEPAGWTKLRHKHYPTNDLNLVTDPFTAEDQKWMRHLLDARLAPLLARLYGIPPRSIQADDLFVVRYDAETVRSKLAKHTDGGDISFTIFLNNDFEGGGTQFWNRHTKVPFAHLQSGHVGHLSTFPALLQHEGYPTTSGRRMILVGFLNVLRYDEDGKTPTGLSWWASWGNLNWAMVRIKDTYSETEWTWNALRLQVYRWIVAIQQWHDQWAVHQILPTLIKPEQLPEFLEIMDNATEISSSSRARWLEGQQKSAFLSFLKKWQQNDDYDEGDEEDDVEEEL
jgi:hypothetical protein